MQIKFHKDFTSILHTGFYLYVHLSIFLLFHYNGFAIIECFREGRECVFRCVCGIHVIENRDLQICMQLKLQISLRHNITDNVFYGL